MMSSATSFPASPWCSELSVSPFGAAPLTRAISIKSTFTAAASLLFPAYRIIEEQEKSDNPPYLLLKRGRPLINGVTRKKPASAEEVQDEKINPNGPNQGAAEFLREKADLDAYIGLSSLSAAGTKS